VSDDAGVAGAGYADKATLIGAGPRLEEADVKLTIAGRPALVRVRALSRAEAMELQKIGDSGTGVIERRMLSLGMVRPRMTEGDVREWQEHAPAGELEPLTDRIQDLSGVGDDAARDVFRRFEADPAEEFRALSSDETGAHSGRDTADAER
jgi:hypothetical protein